MRRFAVGSPRSIAFASVTSSAAVSSLWRPTSARKSCRLSAAPASTCGSAAAAAFGGLLGLGCLGRRGRLPISRPIRSSSRGQLLDVVLGQLVLERERLELGGLDEAALLGALDELRAPGRSQAVRASWFWVKSSFRA